MRACVCVYVHARVCVRVCSCACYHSVTEKFSEALVILGNEPSLGLFRLQEHVRRSLPILVDHKVQYVMLVQGSGRLARNFM